MARRCEPPKIHSLGLDRHAKERSGRIGLGVRCCFVRCCLWLERTPKQVSDNFQLVSFQCELATGTAALPGRHCAAQSAQEDHTALSMAARRLSSGLRDVFGEVTRLVYSIDFFGRVSGLGVPARRSRLATTKSCAVLLVDGGALPHGAQRKG